MMPVDNNTIYEHVSNYYYYYLQIILKSICYDNSRDPI